MTGSGSGGESGPDAGPDARPDARPGAQRISPSGDFTIHTCAEHKTELLGAVRSGEAVELDLSAVTELDTAGLQIMLMAFSEAAEQGTTLELSGVTAAIAETLSIAGFDPSLRPLDAGTVPLTETIQR
jgi:anti-anti-sigma factor